MAPEARTESTLLLPRNGSPRVMHSPWHRSNLSRWLARCFSPRLVRLGIKGHNVAVVWSFCLRGFRLVNDHPCLTSYHPRSSTPFPKGTSWQSILQELSTVVGQGYCESVIQVLFPALSQRNRRAPSSHGSNGRMRQSLNQKTDIMFAFASARLLSSDLDDMAHHPLSYTLYAHKCILGSGHTSTATI